MELVFKFKFVGFQSPYFDLYYQAFKTELKEMEPYSASMEPNKFKRSSLKERDKG